MRHPHRVATRSRYRHDCMTATNDSSRRYVLPDDAPYLKNLAALWAIEPALAAAIEATDATRSYPTEISKSEIGRAHV